MSIKSFKRFHHILQIQFRFDFRFEFQSNFRFEFRFDSDSIPISLHLILSSLGCLRSGSSGTSRCSASPSCSSSRWCSSASSLSGFLEGLFRSFTKLQSHFLAFLVQLLSSILSSCNSLRVVFDLISEFFDLLLGPACKLAGLCGSSARRVQLVLQFDDFSFEFADLHFESFASILFGFFSTGGHLLNLSRERRTTLFG